MGEGGALRLLGTLLLAGAAVRFATLGEQSFWRDEASTALELHGGLGHALSSVRDLEGMPPGYFVLAWLWSRVFGLGEVGLRSLSGLIGVGTIAVAWALGREWSHRAGLLAAALVAASPFLVWYSQEARPYALLVLLSAIATLMLVRGRPVAWGVAAAAALLTHYFAVFLLVPQAVVLLRRHGRSALTGLAPPAVTGLALVPLVAAQADNRIDWVSETSLPSRVADVAKHWTAGAIGTPVDVAGGLALGLLAVGIALGLGAPRGCRLAGTALAAMALPVALALAGSDYVLDRYLIAALVPLLVVAAAGYATRPAAGVALILLFCAFTLDTAADDELHREDWRAVARTLPAASVVVATLDADRPLRWYAPGVRPATAVVATRDVVLLASWRIGKPRPATPAPPGGGFVLAGRTDGPTTTVVRFRAPAPAPVDPAALAALTLDASDPPVVLRTPAPARH